MKSSDETPATAKNSTPEGQLSLTQILDAIEARAKNVETFGNALCWSAQQGLSYGRTMQESQRDVPALVKALRRATLYIEKKGSEPWANHVKAELAQLLREPAGKQDLEETKDLGEPGDVER